MGNLNRWQVLEKVDELQPATKDSVAEALADLGEPDKLDGAFEAAERHGLIESQKGDEQSSAWVITNKGKRKLAARS
jgi:hypothetical protein